MALIDRLKVTSRKFKDISLAFAKHPVTNDIGAFYDEDAIKRSVTNLVRTRIGERFYNPLIGSDIEDSLFENPDLQMATSIEDDVMLLLENFEPRIRNTEVIVSFPVDTNELNVIISYDIVGIVLPTQKIDFILQSTRV